MKPIIRYVGVILGTLRAEYRQLSNRYFGKIEHFEGNARQVCAQTVDKLWEGDFYRTSLGHFDFFWMRDFGTVCKSLVEIGYQNRVHHTLKWALVRYRRANIISTCIDKAGNCFDAPGPAVDSLPWLLHCLVVSDYPLNKSEKVFLELQLKKYQKKYLEKNGMMKKKRVGEMRDAVIYDRSAYAVSLISRLAQCVKILSLDGFPFESDIYKQDLITNYWNGHYFSADRKTEAFSAESALFPFWLGGIDDAERAGRTFDFINKAKLNEPYPLIYTDQPDAFKYKWWMTKPWMPRYQEQTTWSWHGEFYLHLLRRYGREEYGREYQKFSAMIERHGSFPEMLEADGAWYYAPVYRGDPGMVWAALFLELPEPGSDQLAVG